MRSKIDASMMRLPSAEQPEPKSEVFDSRVLRAASSMFAVSSMIIVELPAPTPYAGVPAQHAAYLHPLAHAAHRIAEPALLNAHVDETRERLLVRDGPGDGLTQPVDAGLVVCLDDRERLARALEHGVQLLLLFLGDALLRL